MPDYRQRPNEITSQIVGYQAVNTVTVDTIALDRVGALIDAAIGAGANRIDSVSFTLRDQSGPRNEAIAKAAADALSQARALAAALGVKLKRVLHASTTRRAAPFRFIGMGMRIRPWGGVRADADHTGAGHGAGNGQSHLRDPIALAWPPS